MAPVRGRTRASLTAWNLCVAAVEPHWTLGNCARAHWGLIECMAPMRERTWASLNPWPLCMSALGPH